MFSYRFESLGNSVYRGFYEGVEFGEVTVTPAQITGVPTNGNQSFSTLVGAVSETNIAFSLFDAQGNQVGVFGGDKVTASEKATASIEITDKDYIIINEFCSFGPGGYGVTNEYERLGGVERKVFFTLTFESEPASGSYTTTTGAPSTSSFSGEISYLGESLDATGGSCSVTNSGSGISIQMDGVTFESSTQGAVEVDGSLVCGS